MELNDLSIKLEAILGKYDNLAYTDFYQEIEDLLFDIESMEDRRLSDRLFERLYDGQDYENNDDDDVNENYWY